MKKYIVKATAQIAGFVVGSILISFTIFTLLDYFQPTPNTIIFTIGMAVMAYLLYTIIKIQASVLESRDKLKNRE